MSDRDSSSTARQVAQWLASTNRAVAFTGAGISTESGIPDFRSASGIWTRYRPVTYQEFVASAESRQELWRQKSEAYRNFAAAKPNVGHEKLARWEADGYLQGIVTQNIDGLHQAAGSRNVWELHGTARQIECIECGVHFAPEPLVEQFLANDEVPACVACGGWLKSAIVLFGQMLPAETFQAALELCRSCNLLLALGSSLVVEPAASLPRMARQSGARLVIINREPTEQDELADAVLNVSIGTALTEIDRWLNQLWPKTTSS